MVYTSTAAAGKAVAPYRQLAENFCHSCRRGAKPAYCCSLLGLPSKVMIMIILTKVIEAIMLTMTLIRSALSHLILTPHALQPVGRATVSSVLPSGSRKRSVHVLNVNECIISAYTGLKKTDKKQINSHIT